MAAAAVATAHSVAVLFYPALGLGRARRLGVLIVVLAAVLLTPLVVPSHRPFWRWFAAAWAVVLTWKLFDLHVGANRGHRPSFRSFLLFLPSMSAVLRKLDDEPRPRRKEVLTQLARGLVMTVLGGSLFAGTFLIDWRGVPFFVEHCVKVVTFFLGLVPATAATAAVLRLLGVPAREMMDNPFAARTPADFWRRYNRPAQQFFHEDVLKPLGGRRALARAILVTFAISAVLHEYVFDIATMRVQGYQTAFFLIQGMAVAATIRVRPKGWSAAAWIAGTFAFNLATGVLFFASVNEIAPFYSRPVPWR